MTVQELMELFVIYDSKFEKVFANETLNTLVIFADGCGCINDSQDEAIIEFENINMLQDILQYNLTEEDL